MSESKKFVDDTTGAIISDDGEYRYKLWRTFDVAKPTIAFIMLNPSTADETADDPTIRRCIGYARQWGYGKLIVGNLFAVRETDPAKLYDYFDPIGPENDEYLREICDEADEVVAAWGTDGSIGDRGDHVVSDLDADLKALGTTKEGHPVHPLYQPSDIEPILYNKQTEEQ